MQLPMVPAGKDLIEFASGQPTGEDTPGAIGSRDHVAGLHPEGRVRFSEDVGWHGGLRGGDPLTGPERPGRPGSACEGWTPRV